MSTAGEFAVVFRDLNGNKCGRRWCVVLEKAPLRSGSNFKLQKK